MCLLFFFGPAALDSLLSWGISLFRPSEEVAGASCIRIAVHDCDGSPQRKYVLSFVSNSSGMHMHAVVLIMQKYG